MQVIRDRVEYVCEYLFAGNFARFVRALGLNYRHVYNALYDGNQVTSRMLAQIVSKTNVRAEWLLTGAGPMLATAENAIEPAFQLPEKLSSVFPVFDTGLLTGAPIARQKSSRKKLRRGSNPITAAHAIHSCRVFGSPVCFFLGSDAFASKAVRQAAREIFSNKYVTSVALTAGCLPYELTAHTDMHFAVRAAAVNGVGLGEAFCRWTERRKRSFFNTALNIKTPITVHTELGEMALHAQPGLHGAELGAAWGAAAYADHLILAEQLHRFRTEVGGVCVIMGETERWLRLIFETLTAVSAARADKPLNDFTVIQVGAAVNDTQEQVKSYGGHFYHIQGTYGIAAHKLLRACAAVFDGKTKHDY